MTDDIFAKLGIEAPAPQAADDSDLAVEGAEAGDGDATPPSPTALVLDEWDLRRGEQCLEVSPALQAAFPGLNMAVLDDARKDAERAVADVHGVAYLPEPRLAEVPEDPRRAEFVKQLLETPDCRVLRQSTVLNDLAAEMAANQFGTEYGAYVKKLDELDKKNAGLRAKGKGPSKEKETMQREMALRGSVNKALAEAKKDVDEFDEACKGIGGDGADGNNPQEAKKVAAYYKKIRNSRNLREILNRAGRFRRFMQSQQRRKTRHGLDDVVGVEMGGDVHRLLPVELAKLADEDLELDAMRRLVERQSMCRLHQGTEKVARGPVVVCVDESGSMSGEPIWNAKAFALAMAMMAKQQGRWCALVGYSGGTQGTRLVLKPGKWDQAKLLEWLEHFFSGGTDMDVPLDHLPKWWSQGELEGLPRGKTDVVLITDAICSVPPAMEAKFNAWKQAEKVRCIGLVINEDPGPLAKVCDESFKVKGISVEEEGVARAFSV